VGISPGLFHFPDCFLVARGAKHHGFRASGLTEPAGTPKKRPVGHAVLASTPTLFRSFKEAMTRPERDGVFVTEARAYVDAVDRESSDWHLRCTVASLERALRAAHTLKGAAGFMGEDHVEALAHTVEEVIARLGGAAPTIDGSTLAQIRMLVAALRRRLGASSAGETFESGPRELAGSAFLPLLRQGRRLAAEHGKHVQVCLTGVNVPLPERAVETLRGALGHLIRNAVAHAVEPPDTRAQQGKPYFATILVVVDDRPAEFSVSVHDDGSGFDLATVKERVVRSGLATPEAVAALTAEELIELSFLPGVSTAPEVSALSGRGIGLPAARASIEAAGGRIELTTERGRGTTVVLRLPKALHERTASECPAS
jgi:chemotaxis protein histidine kinase CheA